MRLRTALAAAVLVASGAPLLLPAAGAAGGPPAGAFTINGEVGRPVTLTVGQLAGLAVRTSTISFLHGTTPETHTYTGPLLTDVLAVARPVVPASGTHRLMLTFASTDGFQVSMAYGELEPKIGNKAALLATELDGRSLAADGPLMIIPGDVKGGRDVTNVSSVTVSSVPAPPAAQGDPASITVTGAVTATKNFTFTDLKNLPHQVAKDVDFGDGTGKHHEEGPLLTDLYDAAGLAPPAGIKEGQNRLVTQATGPAEQTAISVGETDANFGHADAMISVAEDSKALDTNGPRLVMASDVTGIRSLQAVHTLTVLNPAPSATVAPGLADKGVRLINANGIITGTGGASSRGDLSGKTLSFPIVAADTAPIPDSYYMAASDGGVFNFGGAAFYGSMGGTTLNKPIVDVSVTPSGKGYWLTASDGGIFAFGDAGFFGSTGSLVLNKPMVAMVPSPTGKGYLMVASDGGVFAFGDARFNGSTGNITLASPIVDFALTPSGNGYLLLAADGGVFAFGDSKYVGRDPSSRPDAVRMIPSVTGTGYRIVHADATVASIGPLPALSKTSVNGAVVTATG